MERTKPLRWIVYALGLFLAACGGGTPQDIDLTQSEGPGLRFKLRAPTQFDDPFCVRIQVSASDFSPIVQDRHFPAGTRSIETVTPNIPVGGDRKVELGIFENDVCGDLAQADWYGVATGVTIHEGAVTLVQMSLTQMGGTAGTGSIIVRGDKTILVTRLHGEVVTPDSTPIPGVRCLVSATGDVLVSGGGSEDLGVIAGTVNVPPEQTELTLECTREGFLDARAVARKQPDPNDPRKGTFTATVEMRPGVQVVVTDMTPEGLEARLILPEIRLETVQTPAGPFQRVANREAFTLLGPGTDHAGRPEIPVFTTYVALPMGATPAHQRLTPTGDGKTLEGRLYPLQGPVRDAAGPEPGAPYPRDDERFRFDPERYAKAQFRAGEILDFEPVVQGESMNLWRLRIALVDFDGGKGLITTYPSLDLSLAWGPVEKPCFRLQRVAKGFSMDPVDGLIEQRPRSFDGLALNEALVKKYTCPIVVKPIFFGARLIIVSPPDFLAAANTLAAHKRALGISTHVVSTDTIASTPDAADIQGYIQNAWDNWWIRPQWVLLLGDAEFIPTHYDNTNFWDSAKNAGDIYYAQTVGAIDSLPELGVGRIPVDTLDQANAVVDKIIAYERKPVPLITAGSDFFARLAFPAQFQDDDLDGRAERWFAETSEDIRGHLVGKGLAVQRIYRAPAASDPTLWRDGGAVPAYLRKPGFPWDGDRNDIIDAVNEGVSILYHRDHGWWWGWGTPNFATGDLGSIQVTDDEYPIVYSINCASGIFDNETVDDAGNIVGNGYGPNPNAVYWAEQFLRKRDGAVAVIGDTRSSATTLNNDLAKGLFDATWPDYQAFGPSHPITRLGDVLNHAKAFVKDQAYGASDERQELVIYNLLGDPTVRVRTRTPLRILVEGFTALEQELIVKFTPEPPCANCPPEALRNPVVAVAQDLKGNVVARAVGRGNSVRLPVGDVGGPLEITLSGEDITPTVTRYPFE